MYNVILVDDEQRTVDALQKNVNWRECGIREVFQAISMESALKVIQCEKIDILVCDIEMPNGSGLQLLEHLRGQGREINCIFVTCHPEFDYMRKAIQLECYDYILKPINYEEFMRVLARLVMRMEEGYSRRERGISGDSLKREYEILEYGRREEERDVEQEVKKYVREHMMDDMSVTEMAKELHFNSQYLTRAFKGRTGQSIVEYISMARIQKAKNILKATGLPIKEVAAMVGFSDYAYFTRVFRKVTGKAPSQYRNED